MFGYRLCLCPTNPGWGLWCVRLNLGFASYPPIRAGVLGCVCLCAPSASTLPFPAWLCGACVRAGALALPLQLLLGCVVCVCVSVCRLWSWPHPVNPGRGVGVCVFVWGLRLYPNIPCLDVRCVFLGLDWGFGCAPPFRAGILGVCVSVCALCLYPANPGWCSWCLCIGSIFGLHPAHRG